jgi:hypothetical protein
MYLIRHVQSFRVQLLTLNIAYHTKLVSYLTVLLVNSFEAH